MFKNLRIHSTVSENPNFFDKILDKVFLWLIPKNIVPNHVTTFRYLSIPVILYLLLSGFHGWSIILFSISAFSDAIDGSLARTRRQITDWGKLHDPLADKLLIGSVGAVAVSIYLSFYLMMVIVIIELFLILNAIIKIRRGDKTITALLPGKVKMILQSVGVGLVLLFIVFPIPWILSLAATLLYLSIFFALLSLIVYSSI
ncbi:MAG: CDP-alcohol phosphatidyltransferase family protein [Candidatus Paceibacterota bacterium]|nr:MAG: CDP-alcohol phosphatidyltransferase family protein [Candidatus Paceibacterota bacterium]